MSLFAMNPHDVAGHISVFLVFLLFVLVSSSPSIERSSSSRSQSSSSFLWRINSSPPCFMFGTIHVPYTRVWDIVPDNSKRAFMNARQAYFELDLTDHATLSALSSCQLLPPGQHISQLLPRDIYLRIKLHLDYVQGVMPKWITDDQREKGFDSDYLFSAITSNWERKQPIWVMLMINSLNMNEIASRGVPVLDLYLLQLAEKQKKIIHAIERVNDQCRPLNNLGLDRVIFALNQTLKAQDNLRLGLMDPNSLITDDMIEEYRRGSLDASFFSQDTFSIPAMQKESPSSMSTESDRKMANEIEDYFRVHLIQKRNKQMAARVIDLLVNRPDSYFFAFGVGHFLGEDSIVEFIESAGFTVDHISPEDTLDFGSHTGNRKHTVQGTFDDLPEDEKTRALLQFLQFHQQLEKESETNQFKSFTNGGDNSGNTVQTAEAADDMDEKTVEESLKVWYGLSNGSGKSSPSYVFLALQSLLILLLVADS